MFRLRITGDIGFEYWADIPDYEGRYQASTFGRVRSIDRIVHMGNGIGANVIIPGKILKPKLKSTGYFEVNLSVNGMAKSYRVHRLVAASFLPIIKGYTQVNHKDENRTNNRVENLEWCTPKYNSNYGTHNEKIKMTSTSRVMPRDIVERIAAKNKKAVVMLKDGVVIRTFASASDAQKENTNFNYVSISAACNGRLKTYRGYEWKFKE